MGRNKDNYCFHFRVRCFLLSFQFGYSSFLKRHVAGYMLVCSMQSNWIQFRIDNIFAQLKWSTTKQCQICRQTFSLSVSTSNIFSSFLYLSHSSHQEISKNKKIHLYNIVDVKYRSIKHLSISWTAPIFHVKQRLLMLAIIDNNFAVLYAPLHIPSPIPSHNNHLSSPPNRNEWQRIILPLWASNENCSSYWL